MVANTTRRMGVGGYTKMVTITKKKPAAKIECSTQLPVSKVHDISLSLVDADIKPDSVLSAHPPEPQPMSPDLG